MSTGQPRRFRVLIVCTANQCRSPLAEAVLRQALAGAGLDWQVTSAGTRAVSGRAPDPSVTKLLRHRGIDEPSWSSSRLTTARVSEAHLILTAAAEHTRAVVALQPRAVRRTFPLLQLARLADQAPVLDCADSLAAGSALLRAAVAARSFVAPVAEGHEDLADPIGRSLRAFRACEARIDAAVGQILRPLTG